MSPLRSISFETDTLNSQQSPEMKREIKRLMTAGYLVTEAPNAPRSVEPDYVRAGRGGGLPWDVQTSDVVIGCLPVSRACYGQCFAADAANRQSIEFGRRIARLFDDELLNRDFTQLSNEQRWVRQGWNGDPSWHWVNAIRLGHIAHNHGRHIVYNSKFFHQPSDDQWRELVTIGAEVRIAIGALDVNGSLRKKLKDMIGYRDRGGTSVATLITSKFKDPDLNRLQDSLVKCLEDHDLPGGELPLRASKKHGTGSLLAEDSFPYDESLWFGRLFPQQLRVPVLSSTNPHYSGLPSNRDSAIDDEYLLTITGE